jgi:prolipoprotein diacylglyceryltransferase
VLHTTFPVYLPLGPLRVHPHWVFEALAYALAFRLYLRIRARHGDPVDEPMRWSVIAAAAVGAALGSKLLALAEHPADTLRHLGDVAYMMSGKTIVGGLVGGLIAVEWTKRMVGEHRSTGDLFVFPLTVGVCVGRVGCFLTGLTDRTYGIATTLPWGIDFGDGIARHPTQVYEIVFVALLGVGLRAARQRLPVNGDLFKAFMIGYLGWRLAVGFIQPEPPFAGLSAIQWVCAATLAYYASFIWRRRIPVAPTETHA